MPDTTPVYGLPYQLRTDPPDGADLGRALAGAIEGELERVDGDLSTAQADLDTAAGDVAANVTDAPLWRGRMIDDRTLAAGAIRAPGSFSVDYALGAQFPEAGASWCRELTVPGIYLVTACIRVDTTHDDGQLSITVRKNETNVSSPSSATVLSYYRNSTSGSRPLAFRASTIHEFVAGDTVMFGVFQNSGDDMNMRGRDTYLELERLRS